jgi:hypothetical protein
VAPPVPEPAHVETDEELVAELADPGAVDGAGAELTVEPPWPGYDALKADDVIERLAVASDAELVVTRLYESLHKGRPTVLAALDRRIEATTKRRLG